MRKFVVSRNIQRYRTLLASEPNPARRAVIERLLAEEQEIWAGLIDDTGDQDGPDDPDGAGKS